MRKRVILTLYGGSIEQEIPVLLRIRESGNSDETQIQGMMPPAPMLLQAFNNLQLAYSQLTSSYRIRPNPGQVTNVSVRSVNSLSLRVEEELNNWLNSDSSTCKEIRQKLLLNLRETDIVEFFIQTNDRRMQQIPWHSWDLVSQVFTKMEIILSPPDYRQQPLRNYTKKVRILAILGDTTDINVEQDKAKLQQQLPDAEIRFLPQPKPQELKDLLWDQQWDILFFAGHSRNQVNSNNSVIDINQNDSLTIDQLKHGLKRARENGLQLAIFNSCDGLGLAQELADLNIPRIIVMRMRVPDFVAQQFLKYFLQAFVANGKPLHLAVRDARERLRESWENEFPCASWLPVIYQNPNTEPLIWQDMALRPKRQGSTRRWQPLQRVILSVLLTVFVIILQRQLNLITFLFHEKLPFNDGDIISLKCEIDTVRGPWLDAVTAEGSVNLAPSTDGGYTGTWWEVHDYGNQVVALEAVGNKDGQRKRSLSLKDNGTVGLSLNHGKKNSSAKWKVGVSDSRERFIRLENQGNFSSNSKLLSCTKDGTIVLAPDSSKKDSSTQWEVAFE